MGAFRVGTGGDGGAGTVVIRALEMVRGTESDEEEDSTLRRGGREVVACEETTGEKLPGTRGGGGPGGCPVGCGMVVQTLDFDL